MFSMMSRHGALRLKGADELPPHITRDEYLQMLEIAGTKHRPGPDKDYVQMARSVRDPLLLRLM